MLRNATWPKAALVTLLGLPLTSQAGYLSTLTDLDPTGTSPAVVDQLATASGVTGYFQTYGLRWSAPPTMLARQDLGLVPDSDAMHFSDHSWQMDFDHPGLSAVFWPEVHMDLRDIDALSIEMYATRTPVLVASPTGQACGPDLPRVEIELRDANGNVGNLQYLHIRQNPGLGCPIDKWATIKYTDAQSTWSSPACGSHCNSASTPEQLFQGYHALVQSQLGAGYKIYAVRLKYGTGADIWWDKFTVGSNVLTSRAQDMTGSGLLPDTDISLVTDVASEIEGATVGSFQSRNVRWSAAWPKKLQRSPLASKTGEAMHFSPLTQANGENFMSASYFPPAGSQLNDIHSLGFALFVPSRNACSAGAPRIVVALNSDLPLNAGSEVQVHAYWDQVCQTEKWHEIDFLNPNQSHWEGYNAGGQLTISDVHSELVALDPDYTVKAIRINFDGGAGPEAWFDDFRVNSAVLGERVRDWSPTAQLPDLSPTAPVVGVAPVPTELPVLGFYQTRNAKWLVTPQALQNAGSIESLRFSAQSRTEDIDFMSASFFPQQALRIEELTSLSADALRKDSYCHQDTMSMVLVLEDIDTPSRTTSVRGTWTGACERLSWMTYSFLDATSVVWTIPGQAAGGFSDAVAYASGWADNYQIGTVRLNIVGENADVWVDNFTINGSRLAERALDWNPGAHLALPKALGIQGDGFVSHIQFPEEQMTYSGDGATLLTPDDNNQIRVRVTPYFDGVESAHGWVGQDGNYAKDPEYSSSAGERNGYSSILNVRFFDHFAGNHLPNAVLEHVGNGVYETSIQLPNDFAGGAYTVVVNDNYPKNGAGSGSSNSEDNRGSYYFLMKEILLSAGGAATAPLADAIDTPSAFVNTDASGASRGYEGPRSLVIIQPAQ